MRRPLPNPNDIPVVDWPTVQRIIRDYQAKPIILRDILFDLFSIPQNIPVYCKFLFPTYFTAETPAFHLEIIDLLQSPGHIGLGAPRRHAKSTLVGLGYLSWVVQYEKYHYIQYFSDTFSQSVAYVNDLKNELEENDLITWLYGEQKGETWLDGDFVTYNGVRVQAKAYGVKVRGSRHKQYRPQLQIFDDMENDENVRSSDQRAHRRSWLTKAAMPAMAKDGKAVFIGTVLHTDSLLNNILNRLDEFASWNTKVFRALNTNSDGSEYSLWPGMYTVEEYKRMRDDPTYPGYMGSLAFAQEMQNEPLSDLDRIFLQAWIDGDDEKPLRYNLSQKMAEWAANNPEAPEGQTWVTQNLTEIVAGVDPAISEKASGDFWAMTTVGFDREGEQWILEVLRVKEGDVTKQAEIILDSYERWKQDSIKIEGVAYQAGLGALVKKMGAERRLYPPIQIVVPDRDKVRRARMHSANFSGKLVHLRMDMENANVFREELLQFPRGAHDDMLDSYMHAAEGSIKKTRGRVFTNKPKGF